MSATEPFDAENDTRSRMIGKAGLGALSLLAANAGVIYLFFYFGLTLSQLVIIYWWESLWIGIFCALKLITASMIGDPYGNRWIEVSGGSAVLISILAIGMVSAEFAILFIFLGLAIVSAMNTLTGVPIEDVMITEIGLLFSVSLLYFAGHGLSFIVNFLVLREFKTARAGTLLFLPFKRCAALLAAAGIAFVVASALPGLAGTSLFAIVLIILKLLWDYRLHIKERRAFAAQSKK